MKRVLLFFAAIMVVVAVNTVRSQAPSASPANQGLNTQSETFLGNPQVYIDLSGEWDCAKLQEAFDAADRNHDAALHRGRLDLAEITVSYMEYANSRMHEAGCYH